MPKSLPMAATALLSPALMDATPASLGLGRAGAAAAAAALQAAGSGGRASSANGGGGACGGNVYLLDVLSKVRQANSCCRKLGLSHRHYRLAPAGAKQRWLLEVEVWQQQTRQPQLALQ